MTTETPTATEQQIVAMACKRFGWIGDPLPSADLRTDLELDSLHLVELQVAIEDHYRVAFDPLDDRLVDAFQTVSSLAAYVDYLRGGVA